MFNLMARKMAGIAAAVIACVFVLLMSSAQAAMDTNSLSFDHAKTGYQLRDIHASLRCEQCHVDGIFKNTPRYCAGCHAVGTRVGATPKPDKHVPTNQACDVCHTSATNFLVKSFSHPGISGNCATCHNGQYLKVISKSATHFPTSKPCETCHTNLTTFGSWKMDHVGISDKCAICHSGQFPGVTSKSASHFVTSKSCEACHSNTVFTSFLDGNPRFDHASNPVPVTGICSSCHGVTPNVTAKPVTHFPTTAQCDSCHTQSNTLNYQSFAGASYSHTAADNGRCSTCHNGSFPNALGKPSTHVQTNLQCDTCHTQANTSNYLTFLGGTFTHATPPGVCSTCHNGATAKGKTPTHVLTNLPCDTCHTQANTSNYLTFLGGIYTHALPIGVCGTCHNGNTAKGKPTVHIITSDDCGICHTQTNTSNYTTFLGATYTHPNPPGVCSTCHNGTTATGKPVYHIPTTGECNSSGCHSQANTSNYTTFFGVVYVHTAPIGVCATCHNGTSAKGKSATHVATTAACDTCHTASNTGNYSTFLGATYQHVAPLAACSSCHNGATAQGKAGPAAVTPAHIVTAEECSVCHTQSNTANYTTFKGAAYTHANPPGACSTCHNGATAQGKAGPTPVVPAHIATTSECNVCHTQANTANYTTFLGATYAHANPPGVCATCHNGSTALGKNPTHVVTTLGCDSCHTQSNTQNYTTFKGATGAVDHATLVPAAAGSCQRSGCHNGVSAKGLSSGHIPLPASAASCDSGGCHTYTGGTFAGAVMNNTPSHTAVASARCDSCHNGVYTTQGTLGAYGKVGNHIPTTITSGLDCNTCHTTTSYSALSNWLTEKMNHNGAQGGGVGGNGTYCVTCHLSGTSYMGTMDKKSHEGTSTAKDCSRSSCHKPLGSKGTTYVNWK